MMYDQHIHSKYSQDGNHSYFEIAEKAVERGLKGITITDHFDLCDAEIGYRFYFDCEEERRKEFEAAREQFADRLEMRWGIEVGQPHLMPEITRDFFESRSFDFVIGAVHFLRGERDIYLIDYSKPGVVDAVFKEYFEGVMELLDFGGFDTLAHLDYPLRVMKGNIESPTVIGYKDYIDPILKRVIDMDISLEINTRGFMDWKQRQEPEDWVLKRYYELGGRRITIGSDAHVLKAVGGYVDSAARKAADIGFKELMYYRERVPYGIALTGGSNASL